MLNCCHPASPFFSVAVSCTFNSLLSLGNKSSSFNLLSWLFSLLERNKRRAPRANISDSSSKGSMEGGMIGFSVGSTSQSPGVILGRYGIKCAVLQTGLFEVLGTSQAIFLIKCDYLFSSGSGLIVSSLLIVVIFPSYT